MVFFCSGISVVLFELQISPGVQYVVSVESSSDSIQFLSVICLFPELIH